MIIYSIRRSFAINRLKKQTFFGFFDCGGGSGRLLFLPLILEIKFETHEIKAKLVYT